MNELAYNKGKMDQMVEDKVQYDKLLLHTYDLQQIVNDLYDENARLRRTLSLSRKKRQHYNEYRQWRNEHVCALSCLDWKVHRRTSHLRWLHYDWVFILLQDLAKGFAVWSVHKRMSAMQTNRLFTSRCSLGKVEVASAIYSQWTTGTLWVM